MLRPDGEEHPLNVAEHFCALVYVNCLGMLVAFAMLPFCHQEWYEARLLQVGMVTSVLFPAWCYKQLLGIGWLRSLLGSLVACLITLTMVVVAVVLMFGLFYGIDAAADFDEGDPLWGTPLGTFFPAAGDRCFHCFKELFLGCGAS